MSTADLTALAAEACNLWQQHLATASADPKARADLMRLMEPSRQMFADWAKKVQDNAHGSGQSSSSPNNQQHATAPAPGRTNTVAAAAGPATSRSSSDDSALRVAQLACRVAELEKRLATLESGRTESGMADGLAKNSRARGRR